MKFAPLLKKNCNLQKNKVQLLKTTCTFKVKLTVVITDSNVGSSYLYMNYVKIKIRFLQQNK